MVVNESCFQYLSDAHQINVEHCVLAMAVRTLLGKHLQVLSASPAGSVSFAGRAASTYSLPDLPYDYGALHPHISGDIMELHHKKHHATYVANLNKASEQSAEAEAKGDVASVIALQGAIKFNGGGTIM